MQCEICRGDMKRTRVLHLKHLIENEIVSKPYVDISYPIFFIRKNRHEYKCCEECWREI